MAGTCAFCGRPAGRGEHAGWRDLGAGQPRCPTCSVGAVNTTEDVRSRLGTIRGTLKDLGFSLTTRVRVELSTSDKLWAGQVRHTGALGTTELRLTGARGGEAVRIRVLAGLPKVVFGRVVAHELGHAWLAQFGARPLDGMVEEGVCELIAYAWLKRTGTPFALALRDQMLHNPDPLYGNGFRTVHAATRQHGLRAIITGLAQSGHLPA
jgi:hypothetical protein